MKPEDLKVMKSNAELLQEFKNNPEQFKKDTARALRGLSLYGAAHKVESGDNLSAWKTIVDFQKHDNTLECGEAYVRVRILYAGW